MTMKASAYGRSLILLLALSWLTACGSGQEAVTAGSKPGDGAMARIEGAVFYRERMMLPPGAEVEVQLQDISRPDALATVLASVLIIPEGGPPYPFVIDYDPATIDQRMRYALRATIAVGDRLMFSSTDYIDPFSGNPVQVLVRRVAEQVQRDGPAPRQVPDGLR
jgi:putative lipoprotein